MRWHALRHAYRSFLDETGAPTGVQQKLMRHANVAATMNIYGSPGRKAKQAANSKVVQMVLTPVAVECYILWGFVGFEVFWKELSYSLFGSSGRTRTYNPSVNSRMLCH